MRTEKYDLIHSLSESQDFLNRAVGKYLSFAQHNDAIDHREQRVQVVRHQKHRDVEVVDQRAH